MGHDYQTDGVRSRLVLASLKLAQMARVLMSEYQVCALEVPRPCRGQTEAAALLLRVSG